MFTFAQWVARLSKGYFKATGKKPDGLAKIKIQMEAAQRVKDQNKVVPFRYKKSFKQELDEMKPTAEDFIKKDDWDPSGMASGGIARVGYLKGLLVKGSKAYKAAQKKKLIEFRKKYRPGFGRSWDDASIEEMDKILNEIKGLGSLDDFVAEFYKQTGKKIKPKDLKHAYEVKLAYPHGTPIIDDTGKILGGSAQQKLPVDPTKFEVRGSNWPLDEPIDVVKKAKLLLQDLKIQSKNQKTPMYKRIFLNGLKN